MKAIRRLAAGVAAFVLLVCVVLFAFDYTPSNPTHRRFSSSSPKNWETAEEILSTDLNFPRNDADGPGYCICAPDSLPRSDKCSDCIATLPISATFRRPDFIGSNFIADSKHKQGYYGPSDVAQLTDYANAANELGYSLWIYVRLDTTPAPEYIDIAESTGGRVVSYFTSEDGYQDGVDQAAQSGAAISLIVIVGILSLEVLILVRRWRRVPSPTPKPNPRRRRDDPVGKAAQAVEDVEDFTRRSKESSRRRAEVEAARDDLD